MRRRSNGRLKPEMKTPESDHPPTIARRDAKTISGFSPQPVMSVALDRKRRSQLRANKVARHQWHRRL